MKGFDQVTQVKFNHGDIDGIASTINVHKGILSIPEVTETPTIILTNEKKKDIDGCNCNIKLRPEMLSFSGKNNWGDPSTLIDEPSLLSGQLRNPICGNAGKAVNPWVGFNNQVFQKGEEETAVIIDLQSNYKITGLSIFDLFQKGWLSISYGNADHWIPITRYETTKYNEWKSWFNLDISTRYLKITLEQPSAIIGEIVLCGYSQ